MTDVEHGGAIGPVGASPDGARPANAARAAIENVVILTASPLRVWSVLTDFAAHSQWKPFVQLAGEAVEGGEATYSFRIGGLGKPVTTTADITRVEKPVVFAWTAGVAKVLLFEELYELESDPAGTRLRHSLRFHGLLNGIWTALLRKKLQAGLVQSDRCLDRRLRSLAVRPNPKPRLLPVRHGGKKTRRHN
ncbi:MULTISPECIES: SRPBCC family protein [unclassified Sphingomonas]|jgi:uncharacterized protein YndB with AHSA1/START domain|uniref:SRPBCC family protein n=1 Tax=unclassified Sphingomonas TaxID=196159 RepID=UPI0006F33279|nr:MULTISPECIES: SRPBCC family protein [unclassified Sphingomonas]KQM97766.1 hypothetical protein ASE77_18305 [Sphingomonas sp. Leaf226]